MTGELPVYSGDWLTPDPRGGLDDTDGVRWAEAYAGQPAGPDTFLATRTVADAIVRTQQRLRGNLTEWFRAAGLDAHAAAAMVQQELAELCWDGDVLVLDRGTLAAEVERVEPVDGLYRIGFGWSWVQVPREFADLIHDDNPNQLPAASTATPPHPPNTSPRGATRDHRDCGSTYHCLGCAAARSQPPRPRRRRRWR